MIWAMIPPPAPASPFTTALDMAQPNNLAQSAGGVANCSEPVERVPDNGVTLLLERYCLSGGDSRRRRPPLRRAAANARQGAKVGRRRAVWSPEPDCGARFREGEIELVATGTGGRRGRGCAPRFFTFRFPFFFFERYISLSFAGIRGRKSGCQMGLGYPLAVDIFRPPLFLCFL